MLKFTLQIHDVRADQSMDKSTDTEPEGRRFEPRIRQNYFLFTQGLMFIHKKRESSGSIAFTAFFTALNAFFTALLCSFMLFMLFIFLP